MMAIGLLILRVLVGALFIGHGTQKLFGWFGGQGIDGAAGFMESVGYRYGRKAAVLAGVTETVSGALLVFGFLTPLAVAGIIGVMLNATVTAHWRKGLWNAKGGFELPLVYAAVVSALGFTGSGRISIDGVLDLGLRGGWFGMGALLMGVVAGMVALSLRRPEPIAEEAIRTERVAA
jgi:putative oxidoreductase